MSRIVRRTELAPPPKKTSTIPFMLENVQVKVSNWCEQSAANLELVFLTAMKSSRAPPLQSRTPLNKSYAGLAQESSSNKN